MCVHFSARTTSCIMHKCEKSNCECQRLLLACFDSLCAMAQGTIRTVFFYFYCNVCVCDIVTHVHFAIYSHSSSSVGFVFSLSPIFRNDEKKITRKSTFVVCNRFLFILLKVVDSQFARCSLSFHRCHVSIQRLSWLFVSPLCAEKLLSRESTMRNRRERETVHGAIHKTK